MAKRSKQIKLTKAHNKQAIKQTDDDEDNEADEINKKFNGVGVGAATQDDDEDEKSEYELSPICKLRLNKKKQKESSRKCRICFQVITKRRECNSNYDSANDDYEINENNNRYNNNNENEDDDADGDDDEDTRDSAEDDDDFSDDNSGKKSNSISDDDSTVDDDNANGNEYGDSDDEKYRKLTYKLPLESIEHSPYLAINNQKMLRWKFMRRDESDWTFDSCSFKIYSSVSKNFQSAYYLLDELIDQLNIKTFQYINDLWNYLIKISCAQVFNKRLKLLSLLIKIMLRVESCDMDKSCINIFALKPLKNLQFTLEMSSKEDRNLSRALFELFFFAEKLAIKWLIQNEYRAQMKDKAELIEKVYETSYFINLILASINMNNIDAGAKETAEKNNLQTPSLKIKSKNELKNEDFDNETSEADNELDVDEADYDSDEDNDETDNDEDDENKYTTNESSNNSLNES